MSCEHVERALAPATVDNLISLDRIVFPPGVTFQPAVGGLSGGTATGSAGSPWRVASMLISAYRGTEKYSGVQPERAARLRRGNLDRERFRDTDHGDLP